MRGRGGTGEQEGARRFHGDNVSAADPGGCHQLSRHRDPLVSSGEFCRFGCASNMITTTMADNKKLKKREKERHTRTSNKSQQTTESKSTNKYKHTNGQVYCLVR